MLARIAILLLGAWICGTVLMAVVATLNFRTVDRILTRTGAEASPTFEEIPEKARRPALRHLASELNRLFFGAWGIAQLVLGGGVLALLFFQTPRGMTNIVLAGVLVALVLIAAAFLTPSMVAVGRQIEFLPRDNPPPHLAQQLATFGKLHAAYSSLDLLKLVLAVFLSVRLIRS